MDMWADTICPVPQLMERELLDEGLPWHVENSVWHSVQDFQDQECQWDMGIV